jgi:aspartate aminotransferase
MAYTAGMIVADAVAANLAKASWIRRMFEEGARLKQERGADKVFDFTLGNPEIEPPPAVLAAARRVLDSRELHLHAYMPNAGHPRVREAVAGRLRVSQPLVQVPGLVLLTIAEGLSRFALLKLFRFPAPFGELMTYVVLPQALYNGFLGAALVLALAWAESTRPRTRTS